MSELVFDRVTVRYGHGRHARVAVDDVTLTVPSRHIVGLVGESGSGKSTLGRAAIGFVPLSGGRITVDGEQLRRASRRRRPRVQMVFQDPFASLDPRMTIGESISEGMPRQLRRNRAGARAEVGRLLSMVNLDGDRAGLLPRTLSGGQRQRVALARAIAARPDVIVADEITAALDVSVQGVILNLARELQRELGLSMLFISHNLAVVRYVSDIVAVMYRGRIVEIGPTRRVLADPQHPYTRELMEAIPRPGRALLSTRPADLVRWSDVDPHPGSGWGEGSGCAFVDRCPVGPLTTSDRGVCFDADPFPGAVARMHRAACHFVPSNSTSGDGARAPVDDRRSG